MTNKEKRALKKVSVVVVEEPSLPVAELVASQQVAALATSVSASARRGIGGFAMNLMKTTQKTNNEILKAVKDEFEGCNTTYACIAWYRSKIRREAAGR